MSNQEVYVTLEFTPNPNTLKYAVSRPVLGVGAALPFSNRASAEAQSGLAAKLLAIKGVASILLGRDFVTVTKGESGDWDSVHQKTSETIREFFTQGEKVLTEAGEAALSAVTAGNSGRGGPGVGSVEERIIALIDQDLRPAVAMDGGDIRFDRFDDGVVYIEMQGACSGCPSSTATLKMGIEARLRESIPEVREVIQI